MVGMIILIVCCGCSHKDKSSLYYESTKQFNKIYFELVESLETLDYEKTIEQLQTEENSQDINKLYELLCLIEKNVPKEREKILNNFKKRYEDLVFLRDSYLKFDKLSRDEGRKINIILLDINLNIDNWNDRKSAQVWE
jgi:hypothetical protein